MRSYCKSEIMWVANRVCRHIRAKHDITYDDTFRTMSELADKWNGLMCISCFEIKCNECNVFSHCVDGSFWGYCPEEFRVCMNCIPICRFCRGSVGKCDEPSNCWKCSNWPFDLLRTHNHMTDRIDKIMTDAVCNECSWRRHRVNAVYM